MAAIKVRAIKVYWDTKICWEDRSPTVLIEWVRMMVRSGRGEVCRNAKRGGTRE